jgi:glycosyltransferase involved in cell wall biosynthesis
VERNQTGWQQAAPCPAALYDAGGVQIGRHLYVVLGYRQISEVNERIFVLDLVQGKWLGSITPRLRIGHSHTGVCSDGNRFIYIASGQYGPHCCPAIPDCVSFDTRSGQWRQLPPLPEARYAGAMHLLAGRLHYAGGARPDRSTPASDHWSIGVSNGAATEPLWRPEPPVPVAGMHRGSTSINGSLFLFGGQQGDFTPLPGDASHRCTGNTRENYLTECFRFDPAEGRWARLADMLIPASHNDFSTVWDGEEVHLLGGQVFKHPKTFRLRLTNAIQSYNPAEDRWRISGRLPYRLKIPVSAIHAGILTITTGQRDRSPADDSPGEITSATWRAPLAMLKEGRSAPMPASPYAGLAGKEVVLISHELTLTGAPLLLIEVARQLQQAGAIVRVFSLADDQCSLDPAEVAGVPVLPVETSIRWAAQAALVIANTAVAGRWVSRFLKAVPRAGSKLVWWIQENDTSYYGKFMECAPRVNSMVFDSLSAQRQWEGDGFALPQRRFVVLPGNDGEVLNTAAADRALVMLPSGTAMLTRSEMRTTLGVSPEEFLLVCIGTIAPHKGQLELVRTVGQLLDRNPELPLSLLLVGFLDEKQRQSLLASLSPSQRRAVKGGRLMLTRRRHIFAFYKAADAFVMNTQGNGEVFGRVSIEAMAFGLPVLGTDAGGTRDIVLPGVTGLLHPVGEAGQEILSANILRLLRDRALAKRMGEAGRERAHSHFSPEQFHRTFASALMLDQPVAPE